MKFSQGKMISSIANAGLGRLPIPKILYRTAFLVALSVSMVGSAAIVTAQEDRPEIMPGERKAPRKKDAGPRAVALLQLSPGDKVSLVPVAILINGKFWDASAYKAAPVPMALEPGTVYEVERTGSSQGLFTVNTALHSNAVNSPTPWIATGAWVPAGTETAKKALEAEAVPVGIDTSDAPPRLTKNPSKETPSTSTAPAAEPSAPSNSAGSSSGTNSGDEPPRLSRPASPPASSASASPSSTPASAPAPGDSKGSSTSAGSNSPQPGSNQTGSNQPKSASTGPQSGSTPPPVKSETAKPTDRPNTPESDSGATEANRPRLRRGKPAESFANEDVPGYTKLGVAPSSITATAVAAKTTAAKTPAPNGPVQLIPAISDAAGPDPHSYGFEWLKGEEGERRQQMIALAKEQLRAYLSAQAKATITPKSAATPASRRAATKKLPEPILSDVQMTAYDLWATNQPVVVFSAQAQMPLPAGQSAPDALQYSILLVAYPDIYNNFHKLYAGVTDKYHLDLTPRLELIDAVDADGDGRGELLFRETSDAGRGWVIYRATADKLWKMYDSLNPE
jgi:hypothetical protein